MKKVYVASGLRNYERVQKIQNRLRACGLEVAFDWAYRYENGLDDDTVCRQEIQAVKSTDALLLVMPGKRGSHVEMGVAIGAEKPVVVLNEEAGDDIQFYSIPGVSLVRSEDDAVAEVLRVTAG